MKITVTQRIEINGHVEEYTAAVDISATIRDDGGKVVGALCHPSETLIIKNAAKELFKSLP